MKQNIVNFHILTAEKKTENVIKVNQFSIRDFSDLFFVLVLCVEFMQIAPLAKKAG